VLKVSAKSSVKRVVVSCRNRAGFLLVIERVLCYVLIEGNTEVLEGLWVLRCGSFPGLVKVGYILCSLVLESAQ
jgi:hypothetical protein